MILEYQVGKLLGANLTNSNVCFAFHGFSTPLGAKMDIREINLSVRTNSNIALKKGFKKSLFGIILKLKKQQHLSEHLAVS